MVHVRKHAHYAWTMGNKAAPEFEFEIFRMSAAEICIQVRTVGNFRHQCLDKAQRTVRCIEVGQNANRVAASVGSIAPGAIVNDRPVHEL